MILTKKVLPMARTLYVPVLRVMYRPAFGIGPMLNRPQYDEFLAQLADVCGGYTLARVQGGYIMPDGSLAAEPVMTVTVHFQYADRKAVSAILDEFTRWLLVEGEHAVLREWRRKSEAGAVLYEAGDV